MSSNPRHLLAHLSVLLLLTGSGCTTTPKPTTTTSTDTPISGENLSTGLFDKKLHLSISGMALFDDGLTIQLNTINDSRCPANVQCIWEGELSPNLTIAHGALAMSQTIQLGTSRTPKTTVNPYTFTLVDATTQAIDLIVSKTSTSTKPVEDTMIITSPKAGQVVKSPLTITGKARGAWFFEASFPIELIDANGKVIANGVAKAQSDWMTSDFVPFTSTLTFKAPTTRTGTLILKNDNPSGLPENADSRSINVLFY